MAVDERRTPPERSIEPANGEPRRGDWSTFWDDPLFSFWRGMPRRGAHVHDPWFAGARSRAGRGSGWEASGADWAPDIEGARDGRATFSNGVLEVVMKAPPREVSRGHMIEIRDADGIPDIGTSPICPE